eukprot:g6711.t1
MGSLARSDVVVIPYSSGGPTGPRKLDFQELSALLKKGDPTLRESEVRRLFREIDQNQDGRIDFGEFCDYVFDNQDEPSVPEEVKDRAERAGANA